MTRHPDFTTAEYRELLRLARRTYRFARFTETGSTDRFILWRHDCDLSLNRARRLAAIEREESVTSTYFVNPHSDFYNLLEPAQALLVRAILTDGHDLGLHFDGEPYDIDSEAHLEELIIRESRWLREWFGIEPVAVSFHNPTIRLAAYEAEQYGGLVNCYSATFQNSIPYLSDSNGVWRFRPLRDALERADEPRLHVLTHPGWWQESAMYPRDRVFRSCYGRARSTVARYDAFIATHGRHNIAGPLSALRAAFAGRDEAWFELCDYLWNTGRLDTLYVELHRALEETATADPRRTSWIALRERVLRGQDIDPATLMAHCVAICERLAEPASDVTA